MTIDFKESAKGTDNYERAIDKHNTSIARAMLVPDLMGFSGSGIEGGSFALGEKQFEIFYTIIEFIRKQLERVVTQGLINPLVMYNFGNNVKATFKFQQVDEQRKTEMTKLWLDAAKSGKIPVTDTHVNWFLRTVKAPEIEQSELAEINAKKKEVAAAIQGGKEEEDKSEEQKEDPKKEKPFTKKYATTYEKKVDFAKIENDLDTIESEYKSQLADMYKLSINALVDEIKRNRIIERKRFDLLNKLELKHQPKIKKLYKNMMTDAMNRGVGSVAKNYIVDDTVVLTDDDITAWVESGAINTTTTEAEFILGKVRPAISEGIRSGASTKDIITMIDEALKGHDITINAGRLETIVRTVVSTGYNEGRAQQFDSIKGEIVAYQYSAILDDRTSPLCERLNGKIIKPNELSLYNAPNHYNCRSLLVPIFKDEIFDGTFDVPPVVRTQGNFVELA
jgi:SPP1 gp7 family putative phage head morphogenesis protein